MATAASVTGKALHDTANNAFKAQYTRYVRNSLWAAFFIHVLVFVLSPEFTFKPYKLKEEHFEVIDVPDNIEIPPPPKEIALPQVPVEAADDDTTEEEMAPTTFDSFEDMPPPPPPTGGGGMQGVGICGGAGRGLGPRAGGGPRPSAVGCQRPRRA